MSAYIVHNDTIDLLVAAAAHWRVTFLTEDGEQRHAVTDRNDAGQLLLDENYRSVNARYDQDDAAPCYRYTPLSLEREAAGVPVAVLVLASVRCLRYQSCETEAYETSPAARFLDGIEAEAERQLINTHDAPWGFTRAWADEKRAAVKASVARSLQLVK
jgi:hypothetical protein